MEIKFTDPQIQRLREYGDDPRDESVFANEADRDATFTKMMSELMSRNERGIKAFISKPIKHRLVGLEEQIARALIAEGFIEVRTPIFSSKSSLAKMTITDDHPLYRQMFAVDDKRFLRPMLAPNLYYVMRKLRDHTDGPVKIFEIGSCFRKESHSNDHLEEFTMLNLVDMGPEGDTIEKLKGYIGIVMNAVGIPDYKLVSEESDVYVETMDVMIGDEEVASGAVGPMKLDPAFDIHEPWCGVGFGLERLIMLRDNDGSVKKTGRSLNYINGYKIN
ncbi:MAG: pyrrolysine--tRNA(Pyl) ligase large subunit [Candidatus Methanomethylophilaceae archaeon]|nr:pyrrolysine--tRNA(Pyl) ligase large subunit [Candidatus Methanomethylophilaceae archaeon]MDD3379444.1 pyrrolysine--tRNA(Pyl) ligase large subunit [Candidatus Methanomethylophilaceae archaeon]MDY0224507.1 pyrrolysine--tRNA(Pyl) ligase large subunit [Candidatus Methanomethylophilaceae archaeon]